MATRPLRAIGMQPRTIKPPGLDALATAVLLLDRDGSIRYANPAAENLFEVSARSVLGRGIAELFPEHAALTKAIRYAAEHDCSSTERDLTLTTQSKTRLELSCTASPVDLPELAGLLLEFVELHQQHRIEREERLLDQSQANRELIRNLAHEIKNPLGALRGAAQLLDRELERPELHEYTQVIITEADRLQLLMDRLLTPHRLPQPAPLNVHEAVERVRKLLLAENAGGIVIHCDYDPSIPGFVGDREQIIQALLNIGRNAAQALHGRGEILFRTRVVRQLTLARKRRRLALVVQIIDNGPGIPEALRERIFLPLVSGRENGTGLGLTLAQTFINQHQGTIEVDSEPGRTCFSVLLPLDGDGTLDRASSPRNGN